MFTSIGITWDEIFLYKCLSERNEIRVLIVHLLLTVVSVTWADYSVFRIAVCSVQPARGFLVHMLASCYSLAACSLSVHNSLSYSTRYTYFMHPCTHVQRTFSGYASTLHIWSASTRCACIPTFVVSESAHASVYVCACVWYIRSTYRYISFHLTPTPTHPIPANPQNYRLSCSLPA
jgi:hypothetical protein